MRLTPVSFPGLAAAAAAVGAIALTAAGCNGSTNTASGATTTTTLAAAGRQPGGPSGPGSGGDGLPGVDGTVAAITGSSMEVQDPTTGQTTVDWTAQTAFTQMATVTASALHPGQCVTVAGTASAGNITARTVTVSPVPASGSCPTGLGGRAFGRPPSTAPTVSSVPRSVPPGRSGRFFGGDGGTVAGGTIVSSSPSSLVLNGTSLTFKAGSTAGSVPPTTASSSNIHVAFGPSTTYTEVRPASATILAVGDCVVANGPADSTGAVTARLVRITSTGGQICTASPGRFGGGAAGANG